jgi:hypothetical protein
MWYADGLEMKHATAKAALRFNEKRQFRNDYPNAVLVNPNQTTDMDQGITLTIHGRECYVPVEGEQLVAPDFLVLLCEDKRTWQLAMAELLDDEPEPVTNDDWCCLTCKTRFQQNGGPVSEYCEVCRTESAAA